MNFIKNNSIILSLIAFCAVLTFFALALGEEEEKAIIVIHKGDTLWSLAEQYKGDIPHEQWISSVMDENDLHQPVIASGNKLVIPASLLNTNKMMKDEIYLAGEER